MLFRSLVLHTSGTTSRPKIVPLTHGNLLASANNIRSTLRLTEADRCLNIMPLFHIHGLIAGVLVAFATFGLEKMGITGIKGVWCHEQGGSLLFTVISIKQMHAGHAKRGLQRAQRWCDGIAVPEVIAGIDHQVNLGRRHQPVGMLVGSPRGQDEDAISGGGVEQDGKLFQFDRDQVGGILGQRAESPGQAYAGQEKYSRAATQHSRERQGQPGGQEPIVQSHVAGNHRRVVPHGISTRVIVTGKHPVEHAVEFAFDGPNDALDEIADLAFR